MGYGLDEVHDRIAAQQLEYAFKEYYRAKEEKKKKLRKIGYAAYDKFWSRLSRAWKVLRGKNILTREQWNTIVDTTIDD